MNPLKQVINEERTHLVAHEQDPDVKLESLHKILFCPLHLRKICTSMLEETTHTETSSLEI
jgi:hypothetical protein